MAIITIDATALTIGATAVKNYSAKLSAAVNRVLNTGVTEIERTAKDLAPADRGFLRQHIKANTDKFLEKSVTVAAPYAAYIEFGTGKLAAQWVGGLPDDWQTFAAQYKGPAGGGNFKQFVLLIAEWMKRKGITGGVYSVKTRRRQGSAVNKRMEDLSLAYFIARSILRKGVNPHPYLWPAYQQQQPKILADLDATLKALK